MLQLVKDDWVTGAKPVSSVIEWLRHLHEQQNRISTRVARPLKT